MTGAHKEGIPQVCSVLCSNPDSQTLLFVCPTGCDFVSKTASKNAKKRANKKKDDGNDDGEEGAPAADTAGDSAAPRAAQSGAAAAAAAISSITLQQSQQQEAASEDPAKRARALQKKLRQVCAGGKGIVRGDGLRDAIRMRWMDSHCSISVMQQAALDG